MLRNNKDVLVKQKRSPKERYDMFMKRGRLAIPALFMPFMVLGGIYGGNDDYGSICPRCCILHPHRGSMYIRD